MKKVKTNNYTPDQIVRSWEGHFRFNKERNGKPGLRSPQIGALHALMAHSEESEDSAIVVMPTGTGKTETMLACTEPLQDLGGFPGFVLWRDRPHE